MSFRLIMNLTIRSNSSCSSQTSKRALEKDSYIQMNLFEKLEKRNKLEILREPVKIKWNEADVNKLIMINIDLQDGNWWKDFIKYI